MEKFRGKYRIESTRLKGCDYSRGGKYYMTIITRNRSHYFGEIINGKIHLNEIGKIANDFWLQIPQHFDNTYLDEYIVMPNHIHGIIVMKRAGIENDTAHLDGGNTGDIGNTGNVGNVGNVETPNLGVSTGQSGQSGPPVPPGPANHGIPPIIDNHSGKKLSIPNYQPGSLGVIINQFKRICTITIRKTLPGFGWQSRFYDEIIRNDERLQQIRTYIRNNPNNWNNDEHYN